MTRVFDQPEDFAETAIDGLVASHRQYLARVDGGVVRSTVTPEGQVAVVIGGGSGHYPAFAGLVGPGLAAGSVCGNLFDRTPFALDKAVEWAGREPEFEKRAGFALMAWSSTHRKDLPDRAFAALLPTIRESSTDDRTYVRKAVSWALRQIGKRSSGLNSRAVRTAERIERIDSPAARWVARDALRELRSDAVQARLRKS